MFVFHFRVGLLFPGKRIDSVLVEESAYYRLISRRPASMFGAIRSLPDSRPWGIANVNPQIWPVGLAPVGSGANTFIF